MVSIIKTAIITIIISFISGLLLEYYKDLAPRILCNIGRGTLLKLNNKRICAYILTVRNLSNKTIHDINVNIQSVQNNLKIGDSKITKGLKFNSSINDNILDVDIPFLSKNDEFSVTLYVENQNGAYNKPVVTIRSPENFKQVESVKQKGILSVLFNTPKNTNKKTKNKEIFNRSKEPIKNKKSMAIILVGVLVVTIGILGKFCFQEISANTQPQSIKVDSPKQAADVTKSDTGTIKNEGTKTPSNGTTKNAGKKTSTGGTAKNAITKEPTEGNAEDKDAKAPSGTTQNKNTPTNGTDENTDTKTTSDETLKNKNEKSLTNGKTENADANKAPSGTTKNIDTNKSIDGTSENTEVKPPINQKVSD